MRVCVSINPFNQSLSPLCIDPPPLSTSSLISSKCTSRYLNTVRPLRGTPPPPPNPQLLGNWMLNLWSDAVCIWSCSKCLPCHTDLLISSLSSAALGCAWICLAVWKTEGETVAASSALMLRWRDFVANYSEYLELLISSLSCHWELPGLKHIFFQLSYCYFQEHHLVFDD